MKLVFNNLKQNKSFFVSRFLFCAMFFNQSNAQIDNNGCVIGKFGIDADLYSGLMPYRDYSPDSPSGTDDWFYGPSGVGVIDTAGGSLY